MKRIMLIGVLLVLLTAGFAFATGEPEEAAAGGPVQLTMFAAQWATNECLDSPCNEYTVFMEEKFNMSIEWVAVPNDQVVERQQLQLASGDYPEIFINGTFNNADQMRYGSQGIFIPLNNLIDNQGPNILAAFEERPNLRPGITTPDGNIYTLPNYSECFHCSVAQKAWINTEWLDALGLDMPETTEEFEAVLLAFKTQDPNGNGIADEVPFTGANGSWHAVVYDYLMNAFLYNDGDRYLHMEDGEVQFQANKPEWRDGLRYVASLYEQGLIDSQAFTQNDAAGAALTSQEPVIVGGFAAGHNLIFATAENEWQKYRAIPPLRGPRGVQYSGFYPGGINDGKFAITDKATQVQADKAFEVADWLYSREGALHFFGKPTNDAGQWNWRFAEPGELGTNGEQAVVAINPEMWTFPVRNDWWGEFSLHFYPAELFLGWKANQDAMSIDGFERFLYLESGPYMPYMPEELVPARLYYSEEDNQTIAQYRTDIETYVEINAAAFITGQKDIDSDWDSYVAGFAGLGLEDYIAETQEVAE